mmetsp:Transcript_26594/g.87322  ORF Transcript_26594/g.87322 Transcript_26594/m.87322 type:complete len:97 (-) Transcript_26594:42-332(-)
MSDGTPYKISVAPVAAIGFVGWVLPTVLIPSNIPLYGGKGLTAAFASSIAENLAKFPAPPALTDPFWLLCFIWHSGLFAVMMFGSIGWNGFYANKK